MMRRRFRESAGFVAGDQTFCIHRDAPWNSYPKPPLAHFGVNEAASDSVFQVKLPVRSSAADHHRKGVVKAQAAGPMLRPNLLFVTLLQRRRYKLLACRRSAAVLELPL